MHCPLLSATFVASPAWLPPPIRSIPPLRQLRPLACPGPLSPHLYRTYKPYIRARASLEGNGRPQSTHVLPLATPTPTPQDSSADSDEIYFDGLSYPTEVLEWCTTNPDSFDTAPYHTKRLRVPHESRPSPFSADAMLGRICAGDHQFYTPRVQQSFVHTFRMSSPYIYAHQGLVFVIHIPGALLEERLFNSVMEDIALMHIVGIKLVLVLGPAAQIDRRMASEQIHSTFIDGIRVTDLRTLQLVKEAAGSMRFEVESTLSRGLKNMPSASRISVVSGSFYSAQPVGIINGQDFGYSGKVRRIDEESINRRLDDGDIVIVPNVGFSPSGQTFNCRSEELAAACAGQLKAEKLIFMGSGETLYDTRTDHTIPNLSLKSAARFLRTRGGELPSHFKKAIECAVAALDNGVRRAHLLNRFLDGVLLMEVFHRDGVGLMISRDLYEGFRRARSSDLNGLRDIIKPLEEQGILKPRSRRKLEQEIGEFVVIERDGMIIACLSLSQMEDDPTWAELGCLAVHHDYRKLGKGDAMLGFTERMAYNMGASEIRQDQKVKSVFKASRRKQSGRRSRGS
ncbi:Amino-acid acetyltransferase [Gracilariopsis chorda]|uniref:amino-acid N-acetyltransferase n=1 Tax=Gracilariopsis chorda TaxID=448386 RepID=A0A2V3IWS8_9FLOR|nr:Amino-acid acetyltransferase [Gracilariopsis chorda]|eukprot:PXF46513.1 Amino-acid acetyltransferase [Gracilariopsis chorda]